jgi:hypothetical protein
MRAVVTIELLDRTGEVVAVRRAKNAVMRAGADLVARLFAGAGTPVTHMGVGTSDAPDGDDFATAALQNVAVGDIPALVGPTEAAIPGEAFQIDADPVRRVVRVRVRGSIPANAAVGTVREAGLVSRSAAGVVLYNRVTFAPIAKGNDHELTMFWEVTFPYGDLQWVM